MVRFLPIALGVFWASCTFADANPPAADDDNSLKNILAVQQAMEQARFLLLVPNSKKAVEVLEAQLPRINGNATYLRLLREAYRTHIKELWLTKQGTLAKKYLERLCIIDPHAAQDPILCGGVKEEKTGSPALARVPDKSQSITAGPAQIASPVMAAPTPAPTLKIELPLPQPAKQPVVRAKVEDPFDLSNQRGSSQSVSGHLQAQGDAEFANKRYGQARIFYEQAYQADPQTINATRQNWAYCILCYVVEQLEQPGASNQSLDELHSLVLRAVPMSPSLAEAGQKIVQDIDNRKKQTGGQAAASGSTAVKVEHFGKNAQGWQVAQTAHFRIFHKQSKEYVETVAQVVERTRQDMYRKWFGHDGPAWPLRCDLFLHTTVSDYTRITGEKADSPGHSRIELDPGSMRVAFRRMDMHCDQNGMLETVLPHETTHTVLAGMFGPADVPRWLDEGVAVLSETSSTIEQYRRNLIRFHREGSLYTVRDLMQMHDFPSSQRIKQFYAQSVFLVEFLTTQRGPLTFSEFARDGLREGYELALRRHYGWSFADLEARWNQYVVAESERLASR